MGEPARGYSWQPFEPRNEAAITHGAHSEHRWRPLAQRLQRAILDECQWLRRPAFAAAVEAWSVVESKAQLVDSYLNEVGLLDAEGVPLPANNLAHQLHVRAITLRGQLGLDPMSFARLLATFSGTPGADDVLEALRVEGARIIGPAVRRARDATGRPTGGGGRRGDPVTALDLMASLVLEDGRRWGEIAQPFQWRDAEAILVGTDGPRLHFCTRPRAGSKTTDLAAIVATELVELPASARVYALAADRDQARLLVDALAGFVARTPGLSGALTVDRWTATATSGARLEVVSADEASSYGLRGHLFVLDELTVWPPTQRGVWVSVLSAVPKVPGCRLVVICSAGDPAHWTHRVREHARGSPAWRLHEVPGPVPWVSPEDLAEQRALLTDSQYARLHLNRWTASEDRLTSAENLEAAVVLPGPQDYRPGLSYRIGADVGLRHDRTALAVCHAEVAEGARRVVLDRLVVFAGTRSHEVSLADVEAALVELWRSYGHPRVRLDPWQAIGIAQRLRQRGVSVEEWSYTPQRYGAMAQTLFALLRDRLLALYPDDALLDELANVRLKETMPGQVRVDHDPGRHDDMAVALGMAATALVEQGVPGPALALAAHGQLPRAVPASTRRRETLVPAWVQARHPGPIPPGSYHRQGKQ